MTDMNLKVAVVGAGGTGAYYGSNDDRSWTTS